MTYGKAGGFANAAFRSRVQASRANARPAKGGGQKAGRGKSFRLGRNNRTRLNVAVGAAGGALAAAGAASLVGRATGVPAASGSRAVRAAALYGGIAGAQTGLNRSVKNAARPKIPAGSKKTKGLR